MISMWMLRDIFGTTNMLTRKHTQTVLRTSTPTCVGDVSMINLQATVAKGINRVSSQNQKFMQFEMDILPSFHYWARQRQPPVNTFTPGTTYASEL